MEKDCNYNKPDMSLFHLHLKFRELCGTSARFLPGCLIPLPLSAHVFLKALYSISLERRKFWKKMYTPAALYGSTFFLSAAGTAANYIMDWHQNALPDHILKEFGFTKIALDLSKHL